MLLGAQVPEHQPDAASVELGAAALEARVQQEADRHKAVGRLLFLCWLLAALQLRRLHRCR